MENKDKEKKDTKPATPSISNDGESVTVPKKTLETILSKIDSQNEKIESQDKQIQTLLKVADKNRLQKEEEKERGPIGKTVKISTYNDKVIVAWKMTKNDVYKDPKTMVWHEVQSIEFIFSDNTKEEFDYLNAIKSVIKIKADVIQTLKDDKTGKESLKVALPDGSELIIGSEFVN